MIHKKFEKRKQVEFFVLSAKKISEPLVNFQASISAWVCRITSIPWPVRLSWLENACSRLSFHWNWVDNFDP